MLCFIITVIAIFLFGSISLGIEACETRDGKSNDDEIKSWSGGVVPYKINGNFSHDEKSEIFNALNEFKSRTCIQFKSRRNQDDYVTITSGDGCNSPIGRQGGEQKVILGKGCLNLPTIEHELMHALGFQHEHTRPDRDDHIKLKMDNVKRGMESQFRKRDKDKLMEMGFEYDYKSVMQYGATAFSKNGKPTMAARASDVTLGPTADGFSDEDVKKINKFYNNCKSNDDGDNKGNDNNDGNNNDDDGETGELNSDQCSVTWRDQHTLENYRSNKDQNAHLKPVSAGNDSDGNQFYVCRALSDDFSEIVPGQLLDNICYYTFNGKECSSRRFDYLTNPNNIGLYWEKHSEGDDLPKKAVVGGVQIDKSHNTYIGRCFFKHGYYDSFLIGKIVSTSGRMRSLKVVYDETDLDCQSFQLMKCL